MAVFLTWVSVSIDVSRGLGPVMAVQISLGLRSVGQVGTTISHLSIGQVTLASPRRSIFIGVMVCNQNCEWSAIIVHTYFNLHFHKNCANLTVV